MQSTESAVAKSSLWTEHLILGRVLASLAPSHKITAGINTHLAWRVPTSWFATELALDRLALVVGVFVWDLAYLQLITAPSIEYSKKQALTTKKGFGISKLAS